MWLEERKTKKGTKYKYCERYKDSEGNTKKVSITLDKKLPNNKIMQLLTKEINLKLDHEHIKANKEVKFLNIARSWLEYTKPTVKSNTHKYHTNYVIKALKELKEQGVNVNKDIKDINPIKIKDVAHKLYYIDNLSHSYTKAVLTTIKAIYKYAFERGYIKDVSKVLFIKVKKKPQTMEDVNKKKDKFLDKDELKDVLKQLSKINKRIGLAMEFISRTGLRIGELLALRYSDYNAIEKKISVNATLRHDLPNNSQESRGTPKNVYSVRDVLLDDRSIDIINFFIADNKRKYMWYKGYEEHGYIFTTARGNPYNLQFIGKQLRKVNAKKPITTHIFRHTHISILAELNLPLKSIMERVGHNEPRTTLAIYTHVSQHAKKEVVNRLNENII